ncbi:MAG: cobaltochelatase CobT-related protein [Aquabacterium sp.]
MTSAVASRQQQRTEELCGAAVRALSGAPDLHFRARRLYRGARLLPIAAPHLYPPPEADFGSFRGAADGLALRVRYSDAALHRSLAPASMAARTVFDLLEQQRVESLVPLPWVGARTNLRHRFDQWSAAFMASDLFETASGLLLFAVAQVTRTRLTGEPVYEPGEDAIETTRGRLAQELGLPLAGLRRDRHDQARFAVHARAVAEKVADMLAALRAGAAGAAVAGDDDTTDAALFTLRVDFGHDADDSVVVATSGTSRVPEQADHHYRVFSRDFDEERAAQDLVRPDELRSLREQLDARVAGSGLNIGRLARAFQALLAQPRPDDWDSGQDEGRIDGRRLAQLVASPAERRLFRTEHLEPQAQAQVTLLLDCSGSMKQHLPLVSVLADVMARALEQAGVRAEVLGFTTAAWNGGRAAKAWQRAGRPPHPGRLNEQRHLVFKAAATPWRRARPGRAALQKAELYREGIDGEAVQWACARMRDADDAGEGQAIDRRILIVVSDGSPMDTATHLANDVHYLDHHLRRVVAQEQARGNIEILGLGVGLDLSPYYGRCQALDPAAAISQATLREVLNLMAGRRHR